MAKHHSSRLFWLLPLLACCISAPSASADASHARIVRLSIVEGDVRFAQDVKGDSLTSSNVAWQTASLNLPIRQGYALATDNGRAAIEFENGAMAFLAPNTILEFYDLSLEDGAKTTRLILRQGTAEFYVDPERGDYFSVTGGDFSVQAEGKTTFRLNNFDDGSNVQVIAGRISVLSHDKTTPLGKGQSLSVQAGETNSETVASAAAKDDFDEWVAGRIQSSIAANAAALHNSGYAGYVSGYGDLYTYGSWFSVAGYGSCWRPYGVGLGWSPFSYGSWYLDPALGWTFVGNQAWGWLPYHYGGWLSAAGAGWCWSPGPYMFGPSYGNYGHHYRSRVWRPVTAVWIRSGGVRGIVPAHPLDVGKKTPLNLGRGIFPVREGGISDHLITTAPGEKWKVEGKPFRDISLGQLHTTSAPTAVSRSMFAGAGGSTAAARGRETVTYDSAQHRFVNGSARGVNEGAVNTRVPNANENARGQLGRNASMQRGAGMPQRAEVPGRTASMPARSAMAPPPVPRSTAAERPSASFGSSRGGGWSGGSSGGGGRASAPSSGGSMSAPRSAPASAPASSGGGRPH